MSTVTETTIVIAGHRVRAVQGGQGPTLLFLHGMGGLRPDAPFLQGLARRFRVVAPEHPGFGDTEALPWIETVADLAVYYRQLLRETMAGDGVHLVGHSLGGWLAAEVAFGNPDLVLRLVLSAPAGLRGAQPAVDPFVLDEEELMATAVADPSSAPPAPDPTDLRTIRNRQMVARLAWSPRFFDPKLPMKLQQLHIPTLLLWGEQDPIVPPDRAAAFQQYLPDSRLVTLPDCGHLPTIEQPDAYVDAVTGFLAG
ncbi:MAG: alpha/beta fold hydrolase [Egibacteraceae bacterium]